MATIIVEPVRPGRCYTIRRLCLPYPLPKGSTEGSRVLVPHSDHKTSQHVFSSFVGPFAIDLVEGLQAACERENLQVMEVEPKHPSSTSSISSSSSKGVIGRQLKSNGRLIPRSSGPSLDRLAV